MSAEHFSVDGTLIEAWASMKSFVRKDDDGAPPPAGGGRNREANFRGEKRSNETHASTTDPDARLYRKGDGRESRLAYMGHVLMENRHGLVVGAMVTRATGTAEREAALDLVERHRKGRRRITIGADKGYDVADFVRALRARKVTPHIAVNGAMSKLGTPRRTLIDRRTRRHPGYGASQRHRKRIEEVFGWIKTQAGFAKAKVRGVARVDAAFVMVAAAYNLRRLAGLAAAAP
jgi:IS5 family transposase